MSERRKESKYAKKRRSGKMMYGPAPRTPKWPEFQMEYPPKMEAHKEEHLQRYAEENEHDS